MGLMARRLPRVLLVAAVALALGFVSGAVWTQHASRDAAEFQRKRLALAEADNVRLRALVARHERAEQQAALAARRKEIEQATARIRELAFKRPVTYDVVTRVEIKNLLTQKLGAQYSDTEFESMRLGYVALGLLPPEFPFKQRFIDLLGEQVAAFYDQHQHHLFMFEDATLESPQNRIILSHELTHALQDQHFDLEKLPLEIRDNDDRAMAASALVEGDATLEMNQFTLQDLSWKMLREDLSAMFTKDWNQISSAPRLLRDLLLFPYIDGLRFCTQLHQRNGFAAVSAAYARPPASTAQIIHLEKYLANEKPVRVEWPDTVVLGQPALTDNVLGELGTRIWLCERVDEATGPALASAWRGDRYLVFEHGKALVWRSVWNSPEDAQRFLAASRKAAPKPPVKPSAGQPTTAERRVFEVSTPRPNEVLLLDVPDRRWANALREKFGR